MTTRKRLAAGAVLAGAAGVAGATYRSYRRDLRTATERLADRDSEVVGTSLGTVEYATGGDEDGVPVLVSHGICGGVDAALASGLGILGDGYRVVGVSRFGYLRSDLPDDPTPTRQADAFRELLDHLGIERAVVLAVSAGGPAALRFARQYPGRTRGLVLVSAALPSETPRRGPTGPPAPLLREATFWLAAERFPSLLLAAFGIDRDEFRRASASERESVEAVLDTLLPVGPRREGAIADTEVTNPDVVERFDEYDLESLSVPTLLVHAEDDPFADFAAAERAAERIPGGTLRSFPDGGHLAFGHGGAIEAAIDGFLATGTTTAD